MSNRNNGIGHLAARSLLEEITELREDIHRQGLLLKHIEVMLTVVYCELHASSRPHYLRAED